MYWGNKMKTEKIKAIKPYSHYIEKNKIDDVARKLLMEAGLSNKDFFSTLI